MSSKGRGMTIVVNDEQLPVGIFTDGDLRRLIAKHGDIRPLTVAQGMSRDHKTVAPGALAIEAATLMDAGRPNQMLVEDNTGLLLGPLHMLDLIAAKAICQSTGERSVGERGVVRLEL